MPAPKRARRSRDKSIPIQRLLNTGTQLSAVVVPAGSFSQPGFVSSQQIPQAVHHRIGRMERTIDDLLANVSTSKTVRSDPKPIRQPIDQPVAYDSGFINPSETPMPFFENAIRRVPRNMEDIPVPNQGMFVDPVVDSVRIEMENELAQNQHKMELRKRIDQSFGGGGQLSYADTLRQQRNIQQQMSPSDYGFPPPSPYESAESKIEYA